jgi:hypothetical protein
VRWHARQGWIATTSAASIVVLVAGCICLGISAALYPGGHAFDESARGFAFWRNYWSDLMHPVALGGEPNPLGSQLAQAAALAFAAGLLLFWWAAPEAFHDRTRLRRSVRLFATLSAASLVGVPPGLLDVPHYLAIFLAILMGAAASTATLVGFARAPAVPRWIVALGAAAIASTVVGFGFYARDVLAGGPPSEPTPAAQKVATFFLVAWVLSGAGHQLHQSLAHRRPAAESARRLWYP